MSPTDFVVLMFIVGVHAYVLAYGELVVWKHLNESWAGQDKRMALAQRVRLLVEQDRDNKKDRT